jgi:hypothetical protein
LCARRPRRQRREHSAQRLFMNNGADHPHDLPSWQIGGADPFRAEC